jgi:2-oxoisovalerate dehydrogenase E1 component alpha subunit
MPAHYGSRQHNIVTGSSPVATQTLHAVGVALAAKLRGEDTVALTSLGEGATSQGDFHEALNFASIHSLPVIFLVENNGWAISVPHKKQMRIASLADRADGYGMPGISVDGSDPVQVYNVVREAAERGRRGEGPTLVEARVFRYTAHSSDDDDRTYRPAGEVEEIKARDPIMQFRARLLEDGVLTEEQDQQIRQQVRAEIDDATDFAEKAPYPDPATLLDHVYGS